MPTSLSQYFRNPVFQSRHSTAWWALPVAALALMAAQAAHAQPYVNVTVGGEVSPGVYGEVSMGTNNPAPPVINTQPVIMGPILVGAPVRYIYAPPMHMRDWGRHCGYYRSCGYPVHFVEMHQHNRWWEHHGNYLRGRDHYREWDGYRPHGRTSYVRPQGEHRQNDRHEGAKRGEDRGHAESRGHSNGRERQDKPERRH